MATIVRSKNAPPPNFKGEPGPNVKKIEDWHERLQEKIGERTLRDVASRARNRHGELLAHSTVRYSLLENNNAIRVDTLAALCDAVDADLMTVLTGDDFAYVKSPRGYAYDAGSTIRAIPVVDMAQAHRWQDEIKRPDSVSGVVYLPAGESDGFMAARAVDASMAPRVNKGDVVLFKKGKPGNGELAIVEVGGAGFSTLRLFSKRGETVELKPRNEDFGTQKVAADQITFTARVVRIIENVSGD